MKDAYKNNLIFILILALIGTVLFFTNPREADLIDHLKAKFEQESANEEGIISEIKQAMAKPKAWLVSQNIERQDLKLFSLYKVAGDPEEYKYVGILGTFFELER